VPGATPDTAIVSRANAAPPSLNENQVGQLSLDLAGNLRVVGGASNQTISGTISVGNLPSTQTVQIISGNSSIGSVTVLNFPSTQTVSGAVNQGIPASAVSAWPVFIGQSGNSSIGSVTVIGSLPGGANSIGTVFAQLLGATTSIGSVVLLGGTNSVGTVNAQGMAASGVAVAGNPLLLGLRAATALPTVVANTQAVAHLGDISGRAVVSRSPLALVGKGSATLSSTATTQLLAATSSVSWAIGTLYGTSSTTSTVRADFFDNATLITSMNFGTNTGGTGSVPSVAIYFDPPWVLGSANSLNVKLSVAVTDVRVAVTAYQTNG